MSVINYQGQLSPVIDFDVKLDIPEVVRGRAYSGEYVITPSDEDQVLEVKNLRMVDNIIVHAIPQNYGKVSWDGSILTIS